MKLLRKANNAFDAVLNVSAIIGILLIAFLMVAVCADVLMRYFLNKPIAWVSEITEIGLLFITFLGAAWLLRREGHVKVDMLLIRLRPRVQSLFTMINSVIGTIVFALFAWFSALITLQYFRTGAPDPISVLRIPMYPSLAIISVGSLLLLVQFLRRIYWHLRKWRISDAGIPDTISKP